MAICKNYGHPDLFITFTSNPQWPEIYAVIKLIGHQKNISLPQIMCRIFYQKLWLLIKDITVKRCFSKTIAWLYSIEFQKRGLPHAHIVLFLADDSKIINVEAIDKLISAELPDNIADPVLYRLVGKYMLHGPCQAHDKDAPCMHEGRCTKYFPKKYNNRTVLDECGYPTYRRRNDGKKKKSIYSTFVCIISA